MLRRAVITSLVAVLAGLLVLLWVWRQWTGPGPAGPAPGDGVTGEPTLLFRVVPGMTLSAAADSLAARGILARARVLQVGARLSGRDRDLRAGLFELTWGASPRGILDTLTRGTAVQIKVTIPEGLDAGEIAEIVSGQLGFVAEEFLAAADSLVRSEERRVG